MTDRWKAKIASHSPWKTPQRCPHFHRCEYDYALKPKGIIIDREREKYLTMINKHRIGAVRGVVARYETIQPFRRQRKLQFEKYSMVKQGCRLKYLRDGTQRIGP